MSDSQNDPWLCYGDYICLSTRAGKDTQERKYLFGHSSPLMQLQNVREKQSSTDFASIILAENPATVACADQPETSNQGTFDAITNAREYWFEVLPRTDYDMATQLSTFEKQLSDASKRLSQLQTKKKDVMAKRKLLQQHTSPTAQSTFALNFLSTADIHMSSKPPVDAVVKVGDSSNLVEMQPLNSASELVSPDEVTVKGMQPAAPPSTKSSGLSKLSLGNMANIGRRGSVSKQSDAERENARETEAILSDIETQTQAIEVLKARVTEYKAKMKQEQNGNVETIKRMHGDPLTYGSVVQLSHVASQRLLTFTKVQDRPLELSEHGKQGSLFVIERVSTGVAGGTARIPAQGSNSIRLKSLESGSQYVRMEPNISIVPGTKFGVSLDVELDGVFNADESFQLGTGAASNDNRVDWTIERCKKNSKVSGVEDGNSAEDDGVAVDEVLSGCQIIRVYHRASESYLAATATKMDRGKVFWSHKSQSDASQGSGKIANTYWMVIDGDGDMADSGEDVNGNSPVFLQHVVSGMLLVCIRHLPAMNFFKATYSEEYLSDDEEVGNDDVEEKLIIEKRDNLDHWIQTIRTSVNSVLEYCKKDILPSKEKTTLSDLTNLEYLVSENPTKVFGDNPPVPWHTLNAENGEDEAAALGRFQNDVQEYEEYRSANEDQVKGQDGELDKPKDNGVELWYYRGEILVSMLKDAIKFLFEEDGLTVESIKIKALEIEYELFAWFRMPVFMVDRDRYIRAGEVVDFALQLYKADESSALDNDDLLNPSDYTPSESGGVRMSGGAFGSVSGASASGARMVAQQHFASSVASVPDSTVIRDTRSVISALDSRANASETASLILNDQHAKHPLETLDRIIALFKVRDKKNNLSASENPWTMHVMTPKRIRYFRAKFDDRFSLDTSPKENTSKFLLACRWSFSTRHDKSERKVDEDVNLSNNTLFGVEAIDCKDEIVILGSDLSSTSSLSASTKHKDISMVQLGPNFDKKTFFESPALQQFEQQLCNVEFVSPKNADKIRNGAQVSSIIRNFCAHLKYATDKRELGDSDLEYYVAFVRRYQSRLKEAFEVVALSCVIDGFQPGNTSTATDSQSQLFFGSLGIVQLAFSVIQPLTEQLGWQIEEPPPFFTYWKVRPHHAKVLHYCLEAISGEHHTASHRMKNHVCAYYAHVADTTTTYPKIKADDFFKKWRQRRDKDGKPWADSQMSEVTREVLEELGFPPLRNEAGVETPRDFCAVTHNVFKLFAVSMQVKSRSWTSPLEGLKIPEIVSQGATNVVSPKTYVEAVMKGNFPKATVEILTKKVDQVEKKFKLAFDLSQQDDEDDPEATAYTQNEELWDSLTYAMKPSDFDFFHGKYVGELGLLAFKAIVSPVQASRIRSRGKDFQLDVRPGEQTFYLLKPPPSPPPPPPSANANVLMVESVGEKDFTYSNMFKEEFLPNLQTIIKDGKILEFDQEKSNLLGNSVQDYDETMIAMMLQSQKHLAKILKCIALDDDNTESPWNDLPIFFNFKDPIKYSDFRPILVDIIRQACYCVANLLRNSEENSKKIDSPQVYYVIKNLLPKSAPNQLNIANMLASILKGNFSVIDRMFTDAVYSSLLENMNNLRSNAMPTILQYLLVNRDGTPDYAQQLRVLKSIFQNPYDEGRVLIPRIPSSYVRGTFKSLRLVFDSTYGLAKTKNKPSPLDHPFAYITPPSWAKTADGDKRFFVEPWDVLVPVYRRSGTLGKLFGLWCPPRFFELKTFAHDFDCIMDFPYFSEIKKIETEWKEVHSKTMDEDALFEKERNLKRDWWYCTMKLHVQYLCSCYSLVAKLCANRNQQALNFFYGKQFQIKDQFLVQSWGTRPAESIISVENDGSLISRVSFAVDGASTVAALTHLKPMIPSCGFEFEWFSGRFMYYEVTIESFEGPATKAMLQLGWTHASKERNADSPADGDGAGDFVHSWGMDCIRAIPYDAAAKLKTQYEEQITKHVANLVEILPEAASLTTSVNDLHGPKLQEYLDKISEFWKAKADSMRQGPSVDEVAITETQAAVEKSKHMVRSRVSHRKNIMAQMAAAQRKYDAKDAKEKAKDKLEKMQVDRGLMCFHNMIPEIPDVSSAFLSDGMEAALKNDKINTKTGQPSFRWVTSTVIGVWYDYDTREMGIMREEEKGGKQTCFRKSDTAFLEDQNSVSWAGDIVPCITGKGVNIKVNFGIRQGKGNNFIFFDSQKLNWVRKVPSPSFSISEIKDGKMITDGPHGLKHGQTFRLEVAKTTITPQPSSSPSGDINFRQYTYESHALQNNQLVIFINQETSSNGIEKDQVYLVKVQDENLNDFSIRKLNLKERAPYRVVLIPEDPSNTFDFVRVGEADENLISDPLQLPRIYLNGRVPRATWAPYGDDVVDVTDIYNKLYDDGLRNIGNMEAVCEENSVLYKEWGNQTTKDITANLKDFFKPEHVAIQASVHPERKGVYICDDHGLKGGQFVQFDVQQQPNGIIHKQAYVVNLSNVSDSNQFRLTKFRQDETCFLRVFYSLKLPDTLIGDSKRDMSGKVVTRLKQKSLKYSPCLCYTPPSNVTRQMIPNYAFSNGVAVMPDYSKLCDIVFCDFLPACLRSSCVELLRSCFIDQEPWFLTPPINTIRAISDEPAAPLIKFAGGYPGKTFRDFARRHNYKVGKELPELADDHFGYREDDENFFQDVYDAAGWEQSQTKNPSDFSNKNWNDGSGEQARNIYEPLRKFLLRGYLSPKNAPFELSTRDITIFWGQASCLLWEKSLKSRFLSEKNEDVKIFLKNLINVLQDTLLFQFDESWKGILKVRKRLVGDLELCALSYFEQTDIAHIVAHAIQESQRSTLSDSTSVASTSRTGGLLSCFRRSSETMRGAVSKDDVKDEEQTVQSQYSSSIPQSILEGPERLKLVSDQSTDLAKRYSKHSQSQGGNVLYEYFDWFTPGKTIPIPDYKPRAFSFNELKMMFQRSSGDLLLALCDLMSVSWQIMVDDKITEFLDLCGNWQNETSSLVDMSNLRIADLQSRRIEMTLMKLARDFFDKEKSNSTKSKIDFTDEHDQERNDWVDWFEVIPTLANIPITSTMASKLCIQLHAFPKDVFESIQKTQIVTGQESEIMSKLEVELRTLRALKDDIRLCFFAEEDLLEIENIPNEMSFNIGESWKCVERLIAQLCLEKEYDDSTAELQSWVDPKAARLFVPCDEEDPRYQKLYEIVDSSGGIPPWEESLEYIEMLHDSIVESKSKERKNWDYQKAKSPYFMILPEKGTDQGPTWKECMKVYSRDQDILEEGQEKSIDNSPCQMSYQCFMCNEAGSGYCFCFPETNAFETTETTELKFVHPECVYRKNLAGNRYNEPRNIPQTIEEDYKSLYVSNKADQDATWSNERRALVVDEIKKSILASCDVDKETKAIQKPYLDSFQGVEPATKKDQLQKAMMQLGIIDQLVEIVKIQFPKKYTREQADDYNGKMQKRMQSRRINYVFDKVTANSERIAIVECLMRRVFCLLAQAAAGCPSIQDCLYTHVDFFFSKALEPIANDSALCILNMVQGNSDNATNISTDLLVGMVRVAQDGQNPDDILLLAPFMVQGDKNISINQREILELCIPAEYAVREDCMFILDSDFPSESTTKESFEKWKSRITSLHVTAEKSKFGENPWDLKEHNWRHLLRVASDIVHGGYASKSEPCRSAFHMAFIQTLMACGFNNPEERQNIVLRLPVVQVLHVLNTVCSVVHHRIWGFSFIERCKASLETSVQDLVKVEPKNSKDIFPRDPRLNFMNFDMLLAGKSKSPKNISVLPLCGLLKFFKCYMDMLSNVHFFNDSGAEDVVRRTSEGVPLFTSSAKVSGFITWMGIVLKDVVRVFQRKKRASEVVGAGVLSALGSPVTPDDAAAPLLAAGVSDKTEEPGVDGASEAEPVSTRPAPKLSFGTLAVLSKFKAKAHSYIHARAFADFDKQWYGDNGDISVAEFEEQSHHPLISAALNQIWSKINGLGVNWETPMMQGLKLGDKLAHDSRNKDILSSPKFCRPHWRCPISHPHFVNENLCVLALAVSCVLFDQVPMDWKSGAPPGTDSILGAILSEGYKGQKRPNGSDIDEARDFILAIELLIQEMCENPKLRWHNKKTPAPSDEKGHVDIHSVEITPMEVLEMLTENFVEILGTRSFKESASKFEKYLHKDPESVEMSWPAKLLQSCNETSAIVLIEKKITHWNIIRTFRASLSDGNPIYGHISASQAPVIRRCLSFALVSNWGGWGGLGSEVSLRKMKLIIESIGDALTDICRIAIETLPSFVQQLFQRFEAPKAGSPQAKECIEVGDFFLQLAATLQENSTDTNQPDRIAKICAKATDSIGSPLDYLVHVGETLKKAPKQWSQIESFAKSAQKTEAITEPQEKKSDHSSKTGSSGAMPVFKKISIQDAYKNFLRNPKIQQIVSSTLETNSQNLLFRFLAIDPENRTSPVSSGDLPFSFYSKSSLKNSLDRNDFPKYLNRMVYNLLSVLESVQSMPRGEETNYFIISCLRSLTQVIFCGACVDKSETEKQFGKLSRNRLVLDHERDSVSFFARIGHVQECLVGLCWLNDADIESAKDKLQNFAFDVKNPALVTDNNYKMALKAFSSIANLVTPAAPNDEIREKAMLILSCLLDNCSASVLDRFFDSKDAQVVHSTSNMFARSLQQFIKDYEVFQDRDDDLKIYYEKIRKLAIQAGTLEPSEDEYIRKLIEFETTDWLSDAVAAKAKGETPVQPDANIKAAYESCSSKGFTKCLYCLRLITQMCVQSGKMTRASYSAGQNYMRNQPNSDPALVVDFPSSLNSLGSVIAGRMRLAQANVFDIRILCRLFKAYNSIIFGVSSAETQDLLVRSDTLNLINKTISGLSQRIDDVSAPFFPGNHPVYVLEQMLIFLLSFALSDLDGKICKQLGKSISWMNFFNLISQMHTAATKYESSSGPTKSQVISAAEYKKAAQRISDSAYILYSAVKRRDIEKSAVLEKDWRHANLDAVSTEAQRRVSCVEIVRTPGFAELCFFSNPDDMNEVGDNTQRQLLCLEDSKQLSLRKNLVISEQLRNRKTSGSGFGATFFKILRNVPLILTTLINLLLLGWLSLPIDFSQAPDGWKWPQDEFLWERLVPNITSEDGSYTYDEFQSDLLPNVLPLTLSDDGSEETTIYRNGINMSFLLLAGANIFVCFLNLIYWIVRKARVDVYEYLLTSAYEDFVSPSNKSKKKISLQDLQNSAGGSSFLTIFKIPAFWGRLAMFICSLCILLISPLFSVLFVCDGFRFPGISYIFGAFTAKYKEFLTLGYLTASIIFMNAVIGLVFFWDLFSSGENEAGSSECTTLFQCSLSFIVLGWQGGGLSDLLSAAKDTPQGTPTSIGDPNPSSYRLIISLFWQLLYFVIVPTCLVSTVVGIISDSFGDARQKKSEWKDTMAEYCFVCGRSAADFRDAGLVAGLPVESIVTFEEHVTTEHCVKDYFKLFMGVKSNKNPDLLTAQEHFVLQKINSLDETFFPMDLSISLDAMKSFAESESSAAEEQQKRMDGFEAKLGKVAESIESVASTMVTQDMTQGQFNQIKSLLDQIMASSLELKK